VNDVLEAALSYAARGWAVLPLHSIKDGVCTCAKADFCSSPGKHPTTINGVKDASRDAQTVGSWFSSPTPRNVGIATGTHSGVVVLDVDFRHGGESSLRVLEYISGRLPATLTATTGNGTHLYFVHPGHGVPNSAGTLGDGLDIRGDGGFVVAPPSVHVSGRVYSWSSDVLLAPLPESLGSKVKKKPARTPEQWVNLLDSPIKNGQRHVRMTEVSGKLLRVFDVDTALAFARAVNDSRCVPPLPDDELENLVLYLHNRYHQER
jgi:hypothetical protein